MKFKVLRGRHTEKDKFGISRTYGVGGKDGDIVDSKSDLSKHNGLPPHTPKFEKVDEGTPIAPHLLVDPSQPVAGGVPPVTSPSAPPKPVAQTPMNPPKDLAEYHQQLDKMNVKQLQDHAADEEIDVKGAKTREELLKILKKV